MIEGTGTTSLAYHMECKERRESKDKDRENLILLLEEENGIEAV